MKLAVKFVCYNWRWNLQLNLCVITAAASSVMTQLYLQDGFYKDIFEIKLKSHISSGAVSCRPVICRAVSCRPVSCRPVILPAGRSTWTQWHWPMFSPRTSASPLSATFHHCSIIIHSPIAEAIQRQKPTTLCQAAIRRCCDKPTVRQQACWNMAASMVRSSCSVSLDQENRNNLQTLFVCLLPVKYWGGSWGSGMWGHGLDRAGSG